MKQIDVIDLPEAEAEEARRRLAAPSGVEKRYSASQEQLRRIAEKLGRDESQPPAFLGVCVDKKGQPMPCEPFDGVQAYTVAVGGEPECREKVERAIADLRQTALERVRSGEPTGSEYFDRFLVFLTGQFTGEGRARRLPNVYEGPSEVKGAIASYTPGPAYVMVSDSFCGLSPSLRRKLMGHEFFHHWDNGLDGNPMLPGETAETAAYGVMKHL